MFYNSEKSYFIKYREYRDEVQIPDRFNVEGREFEFRSPQRINV
jgi:hypothetical protein